jgi:hypothetical protein
VGRRVHKEFVPYQNWPGNGESGEYGTGGTKAGSGATVTEQLAGGSCGKTSGCAKASGCDFPDDFPGASLFSTVWISSNEALALAAHPAESEAMARMRSKEYNLRMASPVGFLS